MRQIAQYCIVTVVLSQLLKKARNSLVLAAPCSLLPSPFLSPSLLSFSPSHNPPLVMGPSHISEKNEKCKLIYFGRHRHTIVILAVLGYSKNPNNPVPKFGSKPGLSPDCLFGSQPQIQRHKIRCFLLKEHGLLYEQLRQNRVISVAAILGITRRDLVQTDNKQLEFSLLLILCDFCS